MKRLIVLSVLLCSFAMTNGIYATNAEPVASSEVVVKDAERAQILNERLIQIKEMDKRDLTAVERKELRSEVKMIKEELAQLSGGVYLSIGAIIVVLLLLILLL